MSALDISPYLTLAPRSLAEVRGEANPLADIFGDCDFAYIVGYSIYSEANRKHLYCQDIFPGKISREGVDQAFLDAYETFVDQDDPHRPNSSYRSCISLNRDLTWTPVKLFSGE